MTLAWFAGLPKGLSQEKLLAITRIRSILRARSWMTIDSLCDVFHRHFGEHLATLFGDNVVGLRKFFLFRWAEGNSKINVHDAAHLRQRQAGALQALRAQLPGNGKMSNDEIIAEAAATLDYEFNTLQYFLSPESEHDLLPKESFANPPSQLVSESEQVAADSALARLEQLLREAGKPLDMTQLAQLYHDRFHSPISGVLNAPLSKIRQAKQTFVVGARDIQLREWTSGSTAASASSAAGILFSAVLISLHPRCVRCRFEARSRRISSQPNC